MNVFADYSKYYNLLYASKDYPQETDFVVSLLKKHAQTPIQSILELGAGTGKHAALLAEQGYNIVGIDQSATMLEMAGSLCGTLPKSVAEKIELQQGDVRTYQINKTFDAAVALFHVMSYQITNQDVEDTFNTVKKHIKPGGLFIFDCWYGPAVFHERPEVRHKQFQDQFLTIDRVAVPTMVENENKVKVHYHLYAKQNGQETFQKTEEEHWMRYFFLPEMEQFCAKFGMKIVHAGEWLTNASLSRSTWGACFVVKV
jgi:SAM-dependent methyltransferase